MYAEFTVCNAILVSVRVRCGVRVRVSRVIRGRVRVRVLELSSVSGLFSVPIIGEIAFNN